MNNKVKIAVLSALLCANAYADPVYLPPGSNLVYGASSNNQSIMSSVTNPAAAAADLSNEESQYRFGLINIGGGYEFGNFNDLFNTVDNTKTLLNTPIVLTGNTAIDLASVNNVINSVNTTTAALQKDGNASIFFGGHVPFTPLVVTRKGWGGSFVLDANASAIANMTFIADPIAPLTSAPVGGSYTLPANDSTLLVKAAVVGELGLGYSRPVLSSDTGDLTAGVRAKYYQVKLARDAQQLISSNGAQSTLKASQTYTSNTGVWLDVGTLWTAKRYRVGAWINNINGPSFKFNTITTAELTAAGYSNTAIMNQLAADQTYKMKPQLEMEGAFYSESQNWVLNAALDGNKVQDPVGRDFQWATLSAAYATNSWWIPGVRVGYRTNLAGSKLNYVTGGLTMFKALSLDIAYGLKSITDNSGKSIPRSAMINLGLQMTF
jgi:hypothetical protein